MHIPAFVTDPDPSIYNKGTYIVVDFETTNLEKGTALNPDNKIVLACWIICYNGNILKRHYIRGGEYDMTPLLDDLAKVDFLVAQNAKFELQWLERCGYEIGTQLVYDTLLAEWVIGGNRWVHSDLGMDKIAKRRKLGYKSRLITALMKSGVCPSDMPKSWLLEYCHKDVTLTHDIMRQQLKDVEGTRLLPIIYSRCLVTLALADIERNGAFLDEQAVTDEYERKRAQYVDVTNELNDMTGGRNMNSTPQKIEYIYDILGFKELTHPKTGKPNRTKGNLPKTDQASIVALEACTEEQRKFKALKIAQGKLNAALTKTLDFFIGVCKERGSIFFGEIRQGTTRTHRLSSSGRSVKFDMFPKKKSCQFQNFPNQYKRLIGSRNEGWYVFEGDGAQLEFRVGGHLGRDEQILYDVTHKIDIHSCTRDAINGSLAEEDKIDRRGAKRYTFMPMYGGGGSTPEVRAYCDFFANKYSGLHETQTSWAFVAADKGWIETEWGMKYYFPDVEVQRSGYIMGKQQVFNYPIQAFATGEIIPLALVYFWYRTKDCQLIITNTVHDSIICEVPPEEVDVCQMAATQALTLDTYDIIRKLYGIELTVPLGVGMKFGKVWGVSAFTDEELEDVVQPLREAGFKPTIDDGEVVIDVYNTGE